LPWWRTATRCWPATARPGGGLTLDHPGFVTVISVAFVRRGESVATRPIAWLEHLRRRGARLLAAAALAGSVFGGGGSWSDRYHGERQETYRHVGEGLLGATQAAVNGFGVDA
jgi:hypothetical protein